jgi:hypothetical protein
MSLRSPCEPSVNIVGTLTNSNLIPREDEPEAYNILTKYRGGSRYIIFIVFMNGMFVFFLEECNNFVRDNCFSCLRLINDAAIKQITRQEVVTDRGIL